MRSETSAGIEYQNEHKKIAYTHEFKNFFKEHKKELPGIIEAVNNIDMLSEEEIINKTFEVGGSTTITVLKAVVWDENDPRRYHLRIDIGDDSFFVKSEAVPSRGKGYDEYTDIKDAKDILKNIDGVTVVEPQLGYQHTNGRTFFVSKWYDHPTIKDIFDETDNTERNDTLRDRVNEIRSLLEDSGFHDVGPHNMFYDEQQDVIILFDVFKNPQWLY